MTSTPEPGRTSPGHSWAIWTGVGARGRSATTWTVYSGVRLLLHDDSHIDLGVGSEEAELSAAGQSLMLGATGTFTTLDPQARRMAEEINERVRDVVDAPAFPSPMLASLMRGTRSIAEWRATLEAAVRPLNHEVDRRDTVLGGSFREPAACDPLRKHRRREFSTIGS